MTDEPDAADEISIKMSDTETQLSKGVTPEELEGTGSRKRLANEPDDTKENDKNKCSLELVSNKPTVNAEGEIISEKSNENGNSVSIEQVVKDTEATIKESSEHLVSDSNMIADDPIKDANLDSEVSRNGESISTSNTTSFQLEAVNINGKESHYIIPDEFPNSQGIIKHQDGSMINEITNDEIASKEQITESIFRNIAVTTAASPSIDIQRVDIVPAGEGTSDKVERQTDQLATDGLCILEVETEEQKNHEKEHDGLFLRHEEEKVNECEDPARTLDTAEIALNDVLTGVEADMNIIPLQVPVTKECTTTHEESQEKDFALRNETVNLEVASVHEALGKVASNEEFETNEAEIKERAEVEMLADNSDTSKNDCQKQNLPHVDGSAKDEQGSSTNVNNNLYTTHSTDERNAFIDGEKPVQIAEETISLSKTKQTAEHMTRYTEDLGQEVKFEEDLIPLGIEIAKATDNNEIVTISEGEGFIKNTEKSLKEEEEEEEKSTDIHYVSKYEDGTENVNLEKEIESPKAQVGIPCSNTSDKDGTHLLHEEVKQNEGENLERVPNECINETQVLEAVDHQQEDTSENIAKNAAADKESLKSYAEESSESLPSEELSGNTYCATANVMRTTGDNNDKDLLHSIDDGTRPKESYELVEAAEGSTAPLEARKSIEHVLKHRLDSEEEKELKTYMIPEETKESTVPSENNESITLATDKGSEGISKVIIKEREKESSINVYVISKNEDPVGKITSNEEIKITEAEMPPENSDTNDVHGTVMLHEEMRQNDEESLVVEEESIGKTDVLDIVKPQEERDSKHILQQQIEPENGNIQFQNSEDIKTADPGEDVEAITGEDTNPSNNYNISNGNGPEKDFIPTSTGTSLESEEVLIEASSSPDTCICAPKSMAEGTVGHGDNINTMAEETIGNKDVTQTLDSMKIDGGDTKTDSVELAKQEMMKAEDYMFSKVGETEASNEIVETFTPEAHDRLFYNLLEKFEDRGKDDKSTNLGISKDQKQVTEGSALVISTEQTGRAEEESDLLSSRSNNFHNPHSADGIIEQEMLAEMDVSDHSYINIKKHLVNRQIHQKDLGERLPQQENKDPEVDISIAPEETETAASSGDADLISLEGDIQGNIKERVTEKEEEGKDAINKDIHEIENIKEKGCSLTNLSKITMHADAEVGRQTSTGYSLSDINSLDKETKKVNSDDLALISEASINYTGILVALDAILKDEKPLDQLSLEQNTEENKESGELVAIKEVETAVSSENDEEIVVVNEENLNKEEIIQVKRNENSFVCDNETGNGGNLEEKNEETDLRITTSEVICIAHPKDEERIQEEANEPNESFKLNVQTETPEWIAEDTIEENHAKFGSQASKCEEKSNIEYSSSDGEAVDKITSESRKSLEELKQLNELDSEGNILTLGKATEMVEEIKKEGDGDSEMHQNETEGNGSDSFKKDVLTENSSAASSRHETAENTFQVDNQKASTDETDENASNNSEDDVNGNSISEGEVYNIPKNIGTEDNPEEPLLEGNFGNPTLKSSEDDIQNFQENGKAAEKSNAGDGTNLILGPNTETITNDFQDKGKEAGNSKQEEKILQEESDTVTLPETSAWETKGMDQHSVIVMKGNEFDGTVKAQVESLMEKVEDERKAEQPDELGQNSAVIPIEAEKQFSSDIAERTISFDDEGPALHLEESLKVKNKEQITVHRDTGGGITNDELNCGETELTEQNEATGTKRKPISENIKGECQKYSCDIAPQLKCLESDRLEETTTEEFKSDVKAYKQMLKVKPDVELEAEAQSHADEANTARSDGLQTEKLQDGVQDAVENEIEEINIIDKDHSIQKFDKVLTEDPDKVEELNLQNEEQTADQAALRTAEDMNGKGGAELIHNSTTDKVVDENIKEEIKHKVDIPNVTDFITATTFSLEGDFDCALLDKKPRDYLDTISDSRNVQIENTMPSIGGEVTAHVKEEKDGEVVEDNVKSDVENAAEHIPLQEYDLEDSLLTEKELEKKNVEKSFISSEKKIEASSEIVETKSSDKSIETLEESFDTKVDEDKPTLMCNEKEKDTPLHHLIEKRESEELETDIPANDVMIMDIPHSLEREAGKVEPENAIEDASRNNSGIEHMETGDSMTQHIEEHNTKLPQHNVTENTELESASVHEETDSVVSNDDLGTEEPLNQFKSSSDKDMEVEKQVEPDAESHSHTVTTAKINELPKEKLEVSEPLSSEFPEEKDTNEQTGVVNTMVEKQLSKDQEDRNTETATDDKTSNEDSLKAAGVTTVEVLGEITQKEVIHEGGQAYNETLTESVPISASETEVKDCLLDDKFDENTKILCQTDPDTDEIEGVICGEVDSAKKRKNSYEVVTQDLSLDLKNVKQTMLTETPEAGQIVEGKTASDLPLRPKHITDEAAGVEAICETASSPLLCEEHESGTSMTKQNIEETYSNKDTIENAKDINLTCLQKEDSNKFKVPKQEIPPEDADEKRENIERKDTDQTNQVSRFSNEFDDAGKENLDSRSTNVEELEICQISSKVVSDSRYQDVVVNGKTSQNLLLEEQEMDKTKEAIKEVSHVEYKHELQDVEEGDKNMPSNISSINAEGHEIEKESQIDKSDIEGLPKSADHNEITEDTQRLDNSHLIDAKLIPREETSSENSETLKLISSKEVSQVQALQKDTLQQPEQREVEPESATKGKKKAPGEKLTEASTSCEKTKADRHSKVEEQGTVISGSNVTGNVTNKDADKKAEHKKSHNILTDVGSKVKHSIRKVKQAMSCSANIGVTESNIVSKRYI